MYLFPSLFTSTSSNLKYKHYIPNRNDDLSVETKALRPVCEAKHINSIRAEQKVDLYTRPWKCPIIHRPM